LIPHFKFSGFGENQFPLSSLILAKANLKCIFPIPGFHPGQFILNPFWVFGFELESMFVFSLIKFESQPVLCGRAGKKLDRASVGRCGGGFQFLDFFVSFFVKKKRKRKKGFNFKPSSLT
jgi:hypothetical protein